ncbi:MAG: RtcB family protein [Planctomycetota bacterium]|nr:RtcB family protein [Planctomycetota bacterium]
MNNRQLRRAGVPEYCIKTAVTAIKNVIADGVMKGSEAKRKIRELLDNPELFVGDKYFNDLAREIVEEPEDALADPIDYRTWGDDIDDAAHNQMHQACKVPSARGAALMPDAHVGYGLPIGGVLATEGTVIPYAVGVDIACRMKLSVIDMPTETLGSKFRHFVESLEGGTVFGVGRGHERKQDHAVMDADWSVCAVTRKSKDKAWKQLGSSGSGNHFAEFGVLTLSARDEELGLDAGEYVSLLSHSGSRGTGAAVCDEYSRIAQQKLPQRYKSLGRLAWLDLSSQAGSEYWNAMNLMGEYASANHAVLHRNVIKLLGARVIAGVENHHNFAWKETHGGREVVVHRKGATPAGEGVLGVIPGSMATPAYIVRGKGHAESMNSASHGAGRCMSRTKAKATYNYQQIRKQLEKKGVHVLSAGADEVPYVYKNIEQVMAEQQDLVRIVARFDPKIVKMCGDGSRPED